MDKQQENEFDETVRADTGESFQGAEMVITKNIKQHIEDAVEKFFVDQNQIWKDTTKIDDAKKLERELLTETLTTLDTHSRERPNDILDDMWGLVCNVSGEQNQDWTDAMYRIREKYHKYIGEMYNPTTPDSNEFYEFNRKSYWLHIKDGEVIYAEKYKHQDENFSHMCDSAYCRCSD